MPIGALQPVGKRLSFVYIDRCTVHRDANAVTAMDDAGVTNIPAAAMSTLLLGPGTRITHQAMVLLGESGVTTCWVGEGGIRIYASAPSLSRSTRLLEAQAQLVSNRRGRIRVARQMYRMRFPADDVTRASMQRLRGMEGARIRAAYRRLAKQHGVEWKGRHYDPSDWGAGDRVNRALSAANSCLYGAVHAVIVALGCSPGLGFIHTGHALSFVYDIADLYKVDVSIPAAFAVSAGEGDVSSSVRRALREKIHEHRILERAAVDIHALLGEERMDGEEDVVRLWEGRTTVPGGISYGIGS